MPKPKKFYDDPKKFDCVGEKIERLGAKISASCLFYDLTPGGDHDMCETFEEFINLLIYCNGKKLYSARDKALKTIHDCLRIE